MGYWTYEAVVCSLLAGCSFCGTSQPASGEEKVLACTLHVHYDLGKVSNEICHLSNFTKIKLFLILGK